MRFFNIILNIKSFVIDKLNSHKRNKQLLEFIKTVDDKNSITSQINNHRKALHNLELHTNFFPQDNTFTYLAYRQDAYLVKIYTLTYGYEPKASDEEQKPERRVYIKKPNYEI